MRQPLRHGWRVLLADVVDPCRGWLECRQDDRVGDVLDVPVCPTPLRLMPKSVNSAEIGVLTWPIHFWKAQHDRAQRWFAEDNPFHEDLVVVVDPIAWGMRLLSIRIQDGSQGR